MKIKIKKVLLIIILWALVTTNLSSVFAINIGTGSVTWTNTFDSAVIWDGNLPWTATGSVTGIKVLARVNPILNMQISTGTINLWDLSSILFTSWSLNIEVWTNAVSWVNVTVRSSSWWLTNTADNAIVINNDAWTITDGIPDNYSFSSSTGSINDSNFIDYSINNLLTNTEINDNTTEHIIYTTNRPENSSLINNDIIFNVKAKTNEQTSAWNYQDIITFTVIGNF